MKEINEIELRKYYESKTTVVDIAEKFGVCTATIHKKLRKLGLSRERLLRIEDIANQVFGR